jgi:exodeoxyribonuclease-3
MFCSYRFNAKAKNKGWRLDYFVASKRLAERISNTFILSDVTGSDHVPIGMILTN